jgi:3-methylfumaryl-CoA hydratase
MPLGIHWCLAPPAVPYDALGADGHPATGGFLPPIALTRRMWASSRVQFHETPHLDLPIVRTSTIVDVALKDGAVSGPMILVKIGHTYTQEFGPAVETLIEEHQTLVYRQPAAFRQAETLPSTGSETSKKIVPDSTLLFRYSGLTFNGHRIHYDHNYATHEEGYPGLVVHGPLMATLLMNLAQAGRPGLRLREFEFRGLAPAFVDQALQLIVLDQNAETLEVRNHRGAMIMKASASFADAHEN